MIGLAFKSLFAYVFFVEVVILEWFKFYSMAFFLILFMLIKVVLGI